MIATLKRKNSSENFPVISITGSKSESNRLLILKALYPQLTIENLSESDDTKILQSCLKKGVGLLDIHHAGTAMRFLTAYFAASNVSEVSITGSDRMQQRPIKILVDALHQLGAKITYENTEGYPPLKIKGRGIKEKSVSIKANVSSQYISALMLIAPSLPDGLEILLEGECTSVPYIKMTLALLKKIGVNTSFRDNRICISSAEAIPGQTIIVESDWSSASYFYSILALTETSAVQQDPISITLKSYKKNSLQGDAAIAKIYKTFGIETSYNSEDTSITLTKNNTPIPETISLNLINTPDIAQTIAVTCFALGIACCLTGLHTLKIKETDRLAALKNELEKLGATVLITEDSISVQPSEKIKKSVVIDTYNDHRMAMAFAPMAMIVPIRIADPMVVTKSFPTFWEDIAKVGLDVDMLEG